MECLFPHKLKMRHGSGKVFRAEHTFRVARANDPKLSRGGDAALQCGVTAAGRNLGRAIRVYAADLNHHEEATMPLVLLWVGIPVLLVGGGYFIIHTMH
jgi:hypothetical protein